MSETPIASNTPRGIANAVAANSDCLVFKPAFSNISKLSLYAIPAPTAPAVTPPPKNPAATVGST